MSNLKLIKMKLKKIKLEKEVIERLGKEQMKHLAGRGNFCPTTNKWTYCNDGTCPGTKTYTSCS